MIKFILIFMLISTASFAKKEVKFLKSSEIHDKYGSWITTVTKLCVDGQLFYSFLYYNGVNTVQVKDKNNKPCKCK